jgi:hypothetical protein
MKCPSCSYNHKAKDGGQCRSCGYAFVFYPKVAGGMTDGRFSENIKRASADGTYFFTETQLFVAQQMLGKKTASAGCVVKFLSSLFVVGLASAVSEDTDHSFFEVGVRMALLIAIVWGLLRINRGPAKPSLSSHAAFEGYLSVWRRHQPIDKLLGKPQLDTPPPAAAESDVYDYGVEGVLVLDEDRLVDLFVLNNFHAEQRVAVISKRGYPAYVMPRVQAVLADRPDLPVFVLHGSGVGAQMLPYQLRSLDLGIVDHPIIDLGWTGRDISQVGRLEALADMGDGVAVDVLLPRRLFAVVAAAMAKRVPIAAYLGADDVATTWNDESDRMWIDVSDFG